MKLLRQRANLLALVRTFFAQRDFLEVDTPLLVPSPGLDLHLEAFEVGTRSAARYLITSPEYQMKRLLAEGHERIFQVCKCFRKGEQGVHHNPEFTMLEWYRANAGMPDVMRDTEDLVALLSSGRVVLGERTIDTRAPFERWTVCEAFERFAGIGEDETLDLAANDEERYFQLMVESVEPGIAALDHAVFLVDYPASQASLARKSADDPRVAERFELYVGGIELCNGFGELTDPVEQRARLERDREERKARGLAVYPIDEKFVDSLRHVPPSGGNALGVDRLVALVCGGTEIRRVMTFTVDEL
ncbi:MAG TPA: EF-P lysine aminoacylase EpmA [Polyangiaceae bacterium]|jgi:lysyl-tRNA synthetase class 2